MPQTITNIPRCLPQILTVPKFWYHLAHSFSCKNVPFHFERALVVDEVDYLLEGLRVRVVEEDPLFLTSLQQGVEIRAGDGEEKPVTPKFLPA